MKYACIRVHRGQYPLVLMCRVLGVSRAGFYAAQRRGESARRARDRWLKQEIERSYRQSRRTYGSPRVHLALRKRGIRCACKRVERLMRELRLAGKCGRRRRRSEVAAETRPPAPNLLERRFGVGEPWGVQRVWVADLTYVPTSEGWLYLAAVVKLSTRAVIGWGMGSNADVGLVLRALRMGLAREGDGGGVLHHSDRGTQYAAREYQAVLAEAGMTASMSRRGDCYDNAVAESFFATLEKELIQDSRWRTRREAQAAIFEYIEAWYNRTRLHSSLGYCSPAEYEEVLRRQTAAA